MPQTEVITFHGDPPKPEKDRMRSFLAGLADGSIDSVCLERITRYGARVIRAVGTIFVPTEDCTHRCILFFPIEGEEVGLLLHLEGATSDDLVASDVIEDVTTYSGYIFKYQAPQD